MNTPKKRWFYLIIGTIVFAIAIPLTVYLVQQQQEIRQRAQESVPASPTETVAYPWQYPQGGSGSTGLPVVAAATRSLLATIPFSARNCPKKVVGDADCNNQIDLSDVSYWQIDYEKGTTYYADFNNDGKVSLIDYNIWRKHANIAAIPVVQKISQKLGLEKFLTAMVWKVMNKNTFTAYAQQAIPTVSDSTLVLSADIYRIINQYTDQSYSVQTNETGNSGGQMTYYGANGNQIAQVNNYSQDTATLTTRVGNDTVSVAQNADGLVGQTIQDANGAFKAAQFWPSPVSYARGDFPQSVTLPIGNGFTTVSLLPNEGAQVTNRDTNGATISYTTISGSKVVIEDYANNSLTLSNADTNYTYYVIQNNLGGQTTYAFNNTTVVSTTVTDKNGTTTIIRPLSGSLYKLYITNNEGEKSQQDVSNPMETLGVDSPSPEAMTQITQQYARTRNTSTTSFTSGFAANGRMPAQIVAVNRLLAVQNAQPAVLGAKTSLLAQSTIGTPEVPGTAILASETQTPNSTGPINTPVTNTSVTATPQAASTPEPIPDNTFQQFHNSLPAAAGTPGVPSSYIPGTPQPAVETPTVPFSATLAPGNGPTFSSRVDAFADDPAQPAVPAAPRSAADDAERAGAGGGGPVAPGINPAAGEGVGNNVAPPVLPGRPADDADTARQIEDAIAPPGTTTRSETETRTETRTETVSAPAAGITTAEVSEAVTTITLAPDGSIANSFTTDGSVSTYSNGASVVSNAAEGLSGVSLQGTISVTADHGYATSITIDGNTFSQALSGSGWSVSESVEGAGEVNENTWTALSGILQQQADVTGVDQVGIDGSIVTVGGGTTDGDQSASVPVDIPAGSPGTSEGPTDSLTGDAAGTPADKAPSTAEAPNMDQAPGGSEGQTDSLTGEGSSTDPGAPEAPEASQDTGGGSQDNGWGDSSTW